MEQRTIIICQGIPGSGKSTWAKNWVMEDPDHRVRWNKDSIRHMFGKYWVPEREKLMVLIEMRKAFLKEFMKEGYNIVLDDMNFSSLDLEEIKKTIQRHNGKPYQYKIEYKRFPTSVDE